MRTISKLWWLIAIVTLIAYAFYSDALDDLRVFNANNSGVGGFFSGFVHGLIGDDTYPGHLEEAQSQLVSRAILWQNVFRFCFLAALVSGGLKLFTRQNGNGRRRDQPGGLQAESTPATVSLAACPNCGQQLRFQLNQANTRLRCPKCRSEFRP
jgi:hypothetical protein